MKTEQIKIEMENKILQLKMSFCHTDFIWSILYSWE